MHAHLSVASLRSCLEDRGLAAAAAAGLYDIRALMTYSAVCGIGLDTVPIPGDTAPDSIAALMSDTGAMAFRLQKPLTVRTARACLALLVFLLILITRTSWPSCSPPPLELQQVRLFPCPGLKAGDMTTFESADLCNCAVFAVP